MADNKALTHEQIFYDIHTYTHIYTHAFIHTHMGMADNKALTHEQMFYEYIKTQKIYLVNIFVGRKQGLDPRTDVLRVYKNTNFLPCKYLCWQKTRP